MFGDKINGLAESLGFDERCERRSDDWYALDNVQHRRGKVSKQIKDSKNFDQHAQAGSASKHEEDSKEKDARAPQSLTLRQKSVRPLVPSN
mmetsp:Transcript_30209/g.44129  ORF Transcript_30209/g.44129 Transcript_30209/m.44129 type:complete len:91 (+) Transcript_30209:208-480(+)